MNIGHDLHDRLGEVIGLAQVMRLLARDIAARLQSADELEMAAQLARFTLEAEELQRQCDSFVASHDDLKQSRVAARAREVRTSTRRAGGEAAKTVELVAMLAFAIEDSLTSWRTLARLVALETGTHRHADRQRAFCA